MPRDGAATESNIGCGRINARDPPPSLYVRPGQPRAARRRRGRDPRRRPAPVPAALRAGAARCGRHVRHAERRNAGRPGRRIAAVRVTDPGRRPARRDRHRHVVDVDEVVEGDLRAARTSSGCPAARGRQPRAAGLGAPRSPRASRRCSSWCLTAPAAPASSTSSSAPPPVREAGRTLARRHLAEGWPPAGAATGRATSRVGRWVADCGGHQATAITSSPSVGPRAAVEPSPPCRHRTACRCADPLRRWRHRELAAQHLAHLRVAAEATAAALSAALPAWSDDPASPRQRLRRHTARAAAS